MSEAEPFVRVDQAFHGYDRGHKELASSIRLDDEARQKMLIYSDLLADLGEEAGRGYLTCYSLPTASRHVLARTWSAGPSFRPGSVWTHSLLLDYQALALIVDLVALEPLLMRSGEMERGGIAKPLHVSPSPGTGAPTRIASNAAAAIRALYGLSDGAAEVPSCGRADDDRLALALWRQMWPGMRRHFEFVTGVGAGRPEKGADWMLRFVAEPPDRALPDLSPGLRVLLEDLPSSRQTSLRLFLSRYAVEALAPRRIAAPLAELSAMPKTGFEARLRAVRRVTDQAPLPRLTRDLVSAELEDAANPAALLAVVTEFGDQPLEIEESRVANMAGAMDGASFRQLLSVSASAAPNCLGGRVFDAVVRRADVSRLADAAAGSDRATMLRIRPELLDVIAFWPADDAGRATLIRDHVHESDIEKTWKLLGRSIGPRSAAALLDRAHEPPVSILLELLVGSSAETADIVASWLVAAPPVIAAVLQSNFRGHAEVLKKLADAQITSREPPSSSSAWCSAIRRLAACDAPAVLIVCYIASLRLGGDEGLAAARKVYDPLLRLARRHRLSRRQEHYLETTLPAEIRSWGLVDRLAKTALDRWPPDAARAGALALSSEYDHSRDLVEDAFVKYGRLKIQEALLDPHLPIDLRHQIERKLQPPLKKVWWF